MGISGVHRHPLTHGLGFRLLFRSDQALQFAVNLDT